MSLAGYKIFIDAGHSNKWVGSRGNNLKEELVVLDIAKACKAQLEANGATVGMSRTDGTPVSSVSNSADLDARVMKSNNFGAHIFVSIHNNAHDTTSPNGVETFVRVGASSYTKSLAAKVNSSIASSTGMSQRNPAVKEVDYRVIMSDNKAWAILTEVGFITNPGDAAKLDTLSERQNTGRAIADGIRIL